jgi:hypothetical protein
VKIPFNYVINFVVQGDWKITLPIPDACSMCQKINYFKIRKQKQCFFVNACIHSLPHVWCNPVKSSCVTETVHQTRYCRFVWYMRSSKCIPKTHSGKLSKNEMPGSVRQWILVTLVKKTSLHFDCWKTTDGLARAGYNMTWSAWALA